MLEMVKYTERRKTKPNIYSVLRTGREEHMYVNMPSEDASWYPEGLCDWYTLEDGGTVLRT